MIFEFEGETPEYAKIMLPRGSTESRPKMDEQRTVSMVAEKAFALPGGQGHGAKGGLFLATEKEAEHLAKAGLAKRDGKPEKDAAEGAARETKVSGPTERKAEAVAVTAESAHGQNRRK